ncbi:hypothetical protein IFM89_001758 [Coptis chinensis]|uniref:MADS-box domain-containing protein n=1 Tax=Coptis chinensis TaxID=261450 RepID=A0A835LP93_9MAGN|nr:hypothetical protein IFM89_001758 [Coptis chinensis]
MMSKGTGRKKIEMQMIENMDARNVAFSKRRKSVFRKASELATLCGIHVAVVVFSPGKNAYSFGHPSVDDVLDRFLYDAKPPPEDQAHNYFQAMRNQEIGKLNQYYDQLTDQLAAEMKRWKEVKKRSAQSEKHYLLNANVEELSPQELEQLKEMLGEIRKTVDKRSIELFGSPWSSVAPRLHEFVASSDPNMTNQDSNGHIGSSSAKALNQQIYYGPSVGPTIQSILPSSMAPSTREFLCPLATNGVNQPTERMNESARNHHGFVGSNMTNQFLNQQIGPLVANARLQNGRDKQPIGLCLNEQEHGVGAPSVQNVRNQYSYPSYLMGPNRHWSFGPSVPSVRNHLKLKQMAPLSYLASNQVRHVNPSIQNAASGLFNKWTRGSSSLAVAPNNIHRIVGASVSNATSRFNRPVFDSSLLPFMAPKLDSLAGPTIQNVRNQLSRIRPSSSLLYEACNKRGRFGSSVPNELLVGSSSPHVAHNSYEFIGQAAPNVSDQFNELSQPSASSVAPNLGGTVEPSSHSVAPDPSGIVVQLAPNVTNQTNDPFELPEFLLDPSLDAFFDALAANETNHSSEPVESSDFDLNLDDFIDHSISNKTNQSNEPTAVAGTASSPNYIFYPAVQNTSSQSYEPVSSSLDFMSTNMASTADDQHFLPDINTFYHGDVYDDVERDY